MLESSFGEFAKQTPELFETIIAERDRYMAAKLLRLQDQAPVRRVLAVVGAGHLMGLEKALQDPENRKPAVLDALDTVPAGSNIPWFTLFLIAFLGLGFAWGFQQGGLALAGALLLQWVLITGTGGLIGCLAARGHWLSLA